MHEAKIVKGLTEGREEALDALINLYGFPLLRYAVVILGNEEEAKDIVQETMIRAFWQVGTLRQAAGLKSWLYTITLNLCRDALRSKGRQEKLHDADFDKLTGPSPSAEDEYIQLEKTQDLKAALLYIPVHYREIIVLYYYKEFSIPEISRMTGKPEGTIKSLLSRGRKLLLDYFSERRQST